MVATNINTFYLPGETLLHRADPRLKLCSCLLVVILTFTASSWLELLMPLLLIVLGLKLLAPLPQSFWRLCWMLRWLVLFTLLMHILFTDGRTLLGVSWLSLDGLYTGLLVSLQMLLSVAAAALLSLTTPVEGLVAAFGWFVTPFKWLGCDTDEWQKTLLLAVQFVPVVRDEMGGLPEYEDREENPESTRIPRKRFFGKTLKSLIDKLLTRGDDMAHEVASGKTSANTERLPALFPLTVQDRLLSIACAVMLCFYWVVR